MAKVLRNLTDRPVLLTLSSGETLRLSPRQEFDEVEDVDVSHSDKLDQLVAAGVITIDDVKGSKAKQQQATKGKKDE